MKRLVRKQMRAALAAMDSRAAADKSRRACDALIALDEFRQARVVMIYLKIPNELDADAIARAAWEDGKTVLVPKVVWEDRRMEAVKIDSLDAGLIETPQGLREPPEGKHWPVEQIDFVAAPALAFDRSGSRLGRGGGFYDRFLSSPQMHSVLCGLAFSEQVVDEVPVDGHDHPVDILVTDAETLRFRASRHAAPVKEQGGAGQETWT